MKTNAELTMKHLRCYHHQTHNHHNHRCHHHHYHHHLHLLILCHHSCHGDALNEPTQHQQPAQCTTECVQSSITKVTVYQQLQLGD